jgi:hypothetical protein
MDESEHRDLFRDWQVPLPPVPRTGEGEPRRVGVELEMIGPGVAEVSRLVAEHIGGRTEEKSRYEHVVHGDPAGEWGVELDYEYLKQKGREEVPESDLAAFIDEAAESLVRAGAEAIVPVEVVSPPLPMKRLAEVQSLVARLRHAGARGTGAGISYAFGLQLNPELPSLDADTIVAYLKAFFCLYDWLEKRSSPDFTRRLTRFMAPFPGDYVRKVIDPDYWPDEEHLIDDYLEHNPTRNRALDMLPLFLHLDEERVRAVVDDPRVKPRPTFHYRLPNCEIDRPYWGIHLAWADWLKVEALASHRSRLQRICRAYARWLDRPLGHLLEDWAREVESWLAKTANR